jgi:sodium-dependent phosphate cotransporter
MATGVLHKLASGMSGLFANAGGIKFTSPIKLATKPVVNFVKHFFIDILDVSHYTGYILILIVSIIVLIAALYFIVRLMKTLVVKRAEIVLNNVLGKRGYLGIIAGILFTAFVQSSSITTSLLVPLVAAGILTVETVFPITMGANIGTTITAILASFATGNISGITIAFVHFLFNATGVLFLYPISIFRAIPIRLAKGLGELAYKKRRYAVIYVLTMFFLIPFILIMISEFIRR